MLINLRNALMAGKRLPYDAEVEYLESTGTQYIDLGVIVPPDVDFEFTGSIVSDMTNGCIFGETNTFSWGNGNSGYSLVTTSGGKVYMRYGDNTSTAIGLTTIGTGNTFTASLSGTSFKINGQSVATVARISSFAGTVNSMGVFKRNYITSSASTYSAVRINSLKFGNLFDYIPVRKGTVGYLYDRVSGKLFGNAGTGAFSYGSDVVQVEWLQTSGTQYIDTGVVPGPGLDYSISFAFTSMSSYSYIMGAWSSNNSNYYDLAEQSNTLVYAGLGTTQQAIANIPVGVFSTVEKRSLDIYIDGVKKKSYSADIQSGSISSTILLFGVHRNYGPGYIVAAQPLRVSKYSLTLNGTDIRKFLPVRVGTEGAMMDTLTRRIYRNAGTGAFTYGNDLKYPIPAE